MIQEIIKKCSVTNFYINIIYYSIQNKIIIKVKKKAQISYQMISYLARDSKSND